MLDHLARQLGVSTTVVILLLTLGVAQIATQIYALVDLARRDAVRGGKKWVWALVVALGNLPGAVVYLVVGRESDAPRHDAHLGTSSDDAARRAVDMLYDRRDQP